MERLRFTDYIVVTAIVCILVAIFFPVFAGVHSGPHISCLSNMKQIGLGVMQYSQDYDERMPNIANGKSTWRQMIYPYIKSVGVYQCSSRKMTIGPDGLPTSYAANYSGNYSGKLSDRGRGAFAGVGATPLKLSDFKEPSRLIALCETDHSNAPEFNIDDTVRFTPNRHVLWAGHVGRSSYLFADGHVHALEPMDTEHFQQMPYKHSANLWYRNGGALSANGQVILRQTEMAFPALQTE